MMIPLLPVALASALMAASAQAPAGQAGDVRVRQITYTQLDGSSNAATLVRPPAGTRGPGPAILYLHWYEPPRPTSNRTEFLAEAIELAASGTTSLLVDTPWSAESWFPKRDAAKDYEFTVQMTKDVRRALDELARLDRIAWLKGQFTITT